MNNLLGRFTLLGALVASFSACQSIDSSYLKNVKETERRKKNALIYCARTENCEFERFDKIRISNAESRRLEKVAVKSGILRLQTQSLRNRNPIYLSVPAGQHEVVIRFYPISKDKAEEWNVIHKFNASQRYTFKMYRNRSKQQGSLLNVSAPDPLCVDLIQERTIIRRFCKPYNVLTGLGEFAEKKL